MMASSRPAIPPCDSPWGDSSGRLKVTPLPTLVAVEDAREDWDRGGGGDMQVECMFMCVCVWVGVQLFHDFQFQLNIAHWNQSCDYNIGMVKSHVCKF